MLEKIITKTEFWIIVGVIVGFLLGEGSRYLRYRYRIHKLRSILREELKAISAQIEQKKDIANQAIDSLKNGNVLPTVLSELSKLGILKT